MYFAICTGVNVFKLCPMEADAVSASDQFLSVINSLFANIPVLSLNSIPVLFPRPK